MKLNERIQLRFEEFSDFLSFNFLLFFQLFFFFYWKEFLKENFFKIFF